MHSSSWMPTLHSSAYATRLGTRFGSAEPDDVVILSFSGHGTHDHHLVAHNTSVDALPSTTLAIDELARHFREYKAKAVICILDRCFSGGAPARVLEDSPAPRSPLTPLQEVAGKQSERPCRLCLSLDGPKPKSTFTEISYTKLLTFPLAGTAAGSPER